MAKRKKSSKSSESRGSLLKIIESFSRKKIVVFGDVMLNTYFKIRARRVSPEDEIAIVGEIIDEEFMLGGAGNVAANLRSLGARVTLAGIIRDDSAGQMVERLCEEQGIDGRFMKIDDDDDPSDTRYSNGTFFRAIGSPTIEKIRVISRRGRQAIRIDRENPGFFRAVMENKPEVCQTWLDELFARPHFDAVILSDYDKGLLTKDLVKTVLKHAKSHGPVLVDPKPQNIRLFKGATVICPNKKEAQEFTRTEPMEIKLDDPGLFLPENRGEAIKRLGKAASCIARKGRFRYVIITCGEHGMFSFKPAAGGLLIDTFEVATGDITGAGDTVIATLALSMAGTHPAYMRKKDVPPIRVAAVLANVAAGLVVQRPGTATVTQEEMQDYIRRGRFDHIARQIVADFWDGSVPA